MEVSRFVIAMETLAKPAPRARAGVSQCALPMATPRVPKLLAFDLDGTLLPESKKITHHTREVLDGMVALGTQITLATGKFHHLTLGHGEELELETPLISLDGARIGNRDHPERKHGVPRDIAHSALERYQGRSDHVFADSGEDVMLLRSPEVEYFRHVTRFWADDYRQADDLREHVTGDPAIVTFYGDEQPMRAIADEMREAILSCASPNTPRIWCPATASRSSPAASTRARECGRPPKRSASQSMR